MTTKFRLSIISLVLLMCSELLSATPFLREANFYRFFDGKDYYTKADNTKVDFDFKMSTMSKDGKVVAFCGDAYFDGLQHRTLFYHNFEATSAPIEVPLLERTGSFNTNAGMVSNTDGSRIFFFASDTVNGFQELYMLNALTGSLTVIFHTSSTIENPQDIATDATGGYLYFNEGDNGDSGHLWRVAASAGATPAIYIDRTTLAHPSGGYVRFIDQMDLSDDGETLAFFVEGRVPTDGSPTVRYDKELYVKTSSGIRHITNDDENAKDDVVISGDGNTIVYTHDGKWTVTTPGAVVGSQTHIENGYHSCGNRPAITTDGRTFLGCSNPDSVSSAQSYLIKSDGSGRLMIEPDQLQFLTTFEGFHLSGDGSRVLFKNRSYNYPDEWYNLTVGVFDSSLWTTKVPSITAVNYPADMFTKLNNSERFDISISVSDPQGEITVDNVDKVVLFPSGYEDKSGAGPISISPWINPSGSIPNLYETEGYRGLGWPSNDPVTVRFSVEDEDGHVGYVDTVIRRSFNTPIIMYLLN
ncbi:MAG: hypothetical protein U9N52_10235 [Campylobacterota bacterium]|nr:hypothetical protein [Campylobacterota bacterium]